MLGPFGLLPLLKGWEYKLHEAVRTSVVRGEDPIQAHSVSETGWLLQLFLLTTDAYGKLLVTYQGADLATQTIEIYPEAMKDVGAFTQDPAGWIQRYSRPNPYSTAGIYVAGLSTGGWQGSPLNYVPTVTMSLELPTDSTQTTAYIYGSAFVVALTNKKTFIRSLRRILDPKSSLKIDPALLETGPALLKQLGEDT